MTTYYLADKTKEWNLKQLKIPTDGSFNLYGNLYSGGNVSNLLLGTNISKNISGTNNISIGQNNCSALTTGNYNLGIGTTTLNKITTMSRNIGIGPNALQNLSLLATGLSSIQLSNSGYYNFYPIGTYTFPLNIQYVAGPAPISMPQGVYYFYSFDDGSGFIQGYVTGVTMTYSGFGFTNSTFFTYSAPQIAGYAAGSVASFYGIYSNTNTGNDNLAIGYQALSTTNYSCYNMAIGNYSLASLNQTTSTADVYNNIAIGYASQRYSVTGQNSVSLGNYSLAGNTNSGTYSPSNVICIGNYALSNIQTTGDNSIVIGNNSMTAAINSSTLNNICIGSSSMTTLNGGDDNICIGYNSGNKLTTGTNNIILGNNILSSGSSFTGTYNTLINCNTNSITTGNDNFISGIYAGNAITTGSVNILIGKYAGYYITTGSNNIAIGELALNTQTTGTNNIAIGYQAGYHTHAGDNYNTFVGTYAGQYNQGSQNVGIGYYANYGDTTSFASGTNNVCIGTNAGRFLTTGGSNTIVGGAFSNASGLTTGTNTSLIGAQATPSAATTSNQFVLGSGITNLKCATTTITTTSDVRDKTDIIDLPLGLEYINKTRPVKFMWAMRPSYDASGNEIYDLDCINRNGKIEAGFIAQEFDELQNKTNTEWLGLVFKDNPDRLEATAGKLLPIMVKAIQELSSKVDSLTEQLALLQNK